MVTIDKIMIIKSKNFILRPWKMSDKSSLVKYINNKKIARNLATLPYPYTLKDARKWLTKTIKEPKKKKIQNIHFAIEINNEAVGSIGLHKIHDRKAEVGYWLAEKYWGQGIMTEALKIITKYGFNKLKLVRIFAHVYCYNSASKRVLEKVGYKVEGLLRKDAVKNGKNIDHWLLAKVKK